MIEQEILEVLPECSGYCVCHSEFSSCPFCPCCDGINVVAGFMFFRFYTVICNLLGFTMITSQADLFGPGHTTYPIGGAKEKEYQRKLMENSR